MDEEQFQDDMNGSGGAMEGDDMNGGEGMEGGMEGGYEEGSPMMQQEDGGSPVMMAEHH